VNGTGIAHRLRTKIERRDEHIDAGIVKDRALGAQHLLPDRAKAGRGNTYQTEHGDVARDRREGRRTRNCSKGVCKQKPPFGRLGQHASSHNFVAAQKDAQAPFALPA